MLRESTKSLTEAMNKEMEPIAWCSEKEKTIKLEKELGIESGFGKP